ncbi:MAG: Rne/Rng family ribonuclease [Desulfitobacteriaceae bacterium]|nr:Rne/Rng family ribonuclease [Desulfitobacteriaceae bacterium]
MYKEILIKVEPEETAVAVVEDQQLVEIYLERASNQRLAGNIYKGLVENVLPGMQAAFVDIGLEKNSFLYVEEAIPQRLWEEDEGEHHRYSIGEVLKQGQEILVQIAKEPVGTKGARVTTHLTLPGRYVVLMPTVDYIGISRRIETESERKRLKSIAEELKPQGMGLIVRTVAEGMSADEIAIDIKMLTRLWKKIQNKGAHASAPQLIHKDLELVQRVIRDILTENVDRVLVNSKENYEKVADILDLTAPGLKNRVVIRDVKDIFFVYDIPGQMEKAIKSKVWLKCGGYLIIDQMEALTAIDVNTGKYVGTTNLADTVLKTNLEATVEIARQLRVRNIGGIIIIDFIDMDIPQHRALVLDSLENELKKDKTKTNILGFTQLGLLEMTRKKAGQGLAHVLQKDCPFCEGKGKVLSEESVSLWAKKEILSIGETSGAPAILVEANPAVAAYLIGSGGHNLRGLEQRTGKRIIIKGSAGLRMEETLIRPAYDLETTEKQAFPVKVGDRIKVKVEEPHSGHNSDGIARVDGFVIDVDGGGALLGQEILVEVTKVFRTYAKASVIAVP